MLLPKERRLALSLLGTITLRRRRLRAYLRDTRARTSLLRLPLGRSFRNILSNSRMHIDYRVKGRVHNVALCLSLLLYGCEALCLKEEQL